MTLMKHRSKPKQVQSDFSVNKLPARANINTSVENNQVQTLYGMSFTMKIV